MEQKAPDRASSLPASRWDVVTLGLAGTAAAMVPGRRAKPRRAAVSPTATVSEPIGSGPYNIVQWSKAHRWMALARRAGLRREENRPGDRYGLQPNTIATRLLQGLRRPNGQLVAPVTFGYGPLIKPTAFDMAAARRLGKDSGYSASILSFCYQNNKWRFAAKLARTLAGFMQQIGPEMEPSGTGHTAVLSLWAVENLPAAQMAAFALTIKDPTIAINSLVNTRTTWNDPTTKKLDTEQLASTNPPFHQHKMSQVWRRIRDQIYYSTFYNEYRDHDVQKGVMFVPRTVEMINGSTVSFG